MTEQCCDRFTKDKKSVTVEFRYDNGKESYKICEGMPLIATVNNKDKQIYNTMEFILEEIKKDNNETIFKIKDNLYNMTEFARSFIPAFCVTVYKYQGADINENYNIFDVEKMDKKQLYTALSRTTKLNNIHLTNDDLNKKYEVRRQPRVEQVNAKNNQYKNGKIYKVTFSDEKIYVGSTCEELDSRLKSHLSDKNSQVYKNKDKDPKIELIINAPCNDRKTLEKIENGYIEEYASKFENRLLNVRCNPQKKQKKIEYEVSIENDIILRKRIEALELKIQIKDNEEDNFWYFDNIVDGMRHKTMARYFENNKEKALEQIIEKKKSLIENLTVYFN